MSDERISAETTVGSGKSESRPVFTGLIVYRNPTYQFSLLYPDGWHVFALDVPNGDGALFVPDPADLATGLAAEAIDLGTTIAPDDLPTLRKGFLAGLRKLRGSTIEAQEEYAIGSLVGFEATQSYREQRVQKRRWVRLVYQGSTQVRLIAQGATLEQYEYWLPMFNSIMRTFKFGDWWSEATGLAWLDSLNDPRLQQTDEDDAGERP